jgi:hypothetical protein
MTCNSPVGSIRSGSLTPLSATDVHRCRSARRLNLGSLDLHRRATRQCNPAGRPDVQLAWSARRATRRVGQTVSLPADPSARRVTRRDGDCRLGSDRAPRSARRNSPGRPDGCLGSLTPTARRDSRSFSLTPHTNTYIVILFLT